MLLERLAGLAALIPTTILLTISFFVLVVISKIEKQGLKAFGYVVAALLWAASLLVFSAGIYTLATGRCPMMEMMMRAKMERMHCAMGQMPMMHGGMGMDQPMMKK